MNPHQPGGHPHYTNDPERLIQLKDTVAQGNRRGQVTAIRWNSTDEVYRVQVTWSDADRTADGWTDEPPSALLFCPPRMVLLAVELDESVYLNRKAGRSAPTDLAEMLAALDHAIQHDNQLVGVGLDAEPDPMFAANGACR